ncbi:MAG TPA: glycosyltransferase family 39 protein [Blastocatellia bacterium]|nr:glycosyltransferase family 39 protein [Blastocatellia bacterium]
MSSTKKEGLKDLRAVEEIDSTALPPQPESSHARLAAFAGSRRSVRLVFAVATALSIAWFAYYFSDGMTNAYGDGVAHVNIARKVVDHPDDSLRQRYIQIGSPWLPLQTVLMLPFVANDWMWRTGVAGSIPSMLAFIVGAVALYLLARTLYGPEAGPLAHALPFVSAGIFLLNPSALYMQATPMSELIFMGALVTAAYFLQRWVDDQSYGRLAVAGVSMTVATLARYEAWPVAAASGLIVLLAANGGIPSKLKAAIVYSAIVSAGPVYWLWHNWEIYGDAFEFLRGPYSARGIFFQNRIKFGWTKIFVGNASADLLLMLTMVAVCVGPLLVLATMMGVGRTFWKRRRSLVRHAPAFLLLVPFFFHVMSIYTGEAQMFPLSAFGLLNVRYGLPHLLPVALFAPAAALFLRRFDWRRAVGAVGLLVLLQYGHLLSEGPSQLAVYQDGFRNGLNTKDARERAKFSKMLLGDPPRPIILMHSGALGPVVMQGGLRFSDLIHEGTIAWHGLGEGIPPGVQTIILQQGDPLDERIRREPMLSRDFAEEFVEGPSVGRIKLFRRAGQ